MAAKQIILNETAREQYRRGANILADAVKVTLGPRGHNVVLGRKSGPPISTHDGGTVAKKIEIGKPFANMGVSLIKEAAKTTWSSIISFRYPKEGAIRSRTYRSFVFGVTGQRVRLYDNAHRTAIASTTNW
jgi:hypothetical protein